MKELADDPRRSKPHDNRVVLAVASSMARWREQLFAFMHHNAQRPGAYFKIPSAQVMEIGIEFEM